MSEHFEFDWPKAAACTAKLLTIIAGEEGDLGQAEALIQESMTLCPHIGSRDHVHRLVLFSKLASKRGDFKAAQEAYNKALELQPNDAATKTDLAIALISMNQQKEAVPLLESAIKDDPTSIVAHYRLSGLYRRAGRLADAKHEMDQYTHYKGLKDKMSEVFKQVSTQDTPK